LEHLFVTLGKKATLKVNQSNKPAVQGVLTGELLNTGLGPSDTAMRHETPIFAGFPLSSQAVKYGSGA
jgi:hypothetical protein